MPRNDALLPPGTKPWTLDLVPRDERWDALMDWLTRVPDAERDEDDEEPEAAVAD